MNSRNSTIRRPVATVFGGSGFVARYIIARLARAGYHVRAASRHPSRAHYLLPLGAGGQIERIYAPLQAPEKVEAAVAGATLVINTVGLLVRQGREQTFDKTMHKGAEVIAQKSAQSGVNRLIHISSIGASFDGPSQYAKAKAAGEYAIKAAFPNVTILRPSIIFGAEDQFFNRFATMPAIPLIGGGKTRFQPVYVEDVAKAVEACWSNNATCQKTYELGGPTILSFRDCMELMLDSIGVKRPLIHMPWGLAEIVGAIGDIVPNMPLTSDQVRSLTVDNIVSDDAFSFADLGIKPTDLRAILPTYMEKFTPGGKWRLYKS